MFGTRSTRLMTLTTLATCLSVAHASHAFGQDAPPPPPPQAVPPSAPPAAPPPAHEEYSTQIVSNQAPKPEAAVKRDEFGRKKHAPAITLGLQAGVTFYEEGGPFGTEVGIGRALNAGPHAGVRGSFEIFSWLAIDGRFTGSNNHANGLVQNGSLSTVGGFGAVRFTLPLFKVRPYVFGGFGGYRLLAGGATTQLVNSSATAFEAGIGALVPISFHWDLGAEYAYAHLNGEVLSTNPKADGGDPTNFSLLAQYRFQL